MKRSRTGGKSPGDHAMIWIALFKLFKGVLLVAIAIGALKLLHQNVADALTHLLESLRADPDNHLIHKGLMKVSRINDHKLEEISAGSFIYAALLLTEGTGLLLRKHWAEYFTVITTASLMPLELYELIERFTLIRLAALVLNAVIVVYLIVRLRRHRSEHHPIGRQH